MNKANEFIRTAALVVMALAMIFGFSGLIGVASPEQEMGTSHITSDVEFLGTASFATGDLSLTTGDIGITAGNLTVGNGTASVTQDGEDAYVEGQFEVDGEAQFDGAIDANSTATFAGLITTDAGLEVGTDLDVDGTANLDDADIDLSASLNIDGHMVDIGSGTYTHADADNELGVAGDVEVEGMVYADAGATILVGLTTGADGAGVDVTFHSATAGDLFLWDASEEALILTGTDSQNALSVPDGNVSVTDNLDVGGTVNFGAANLYPVGYASSGQQIVYGTSTITGTAVAAHGLTTVTFAQCTLGEDPETGAGDAAFCTVTVAANVVTVKAWQDDFTAATEADVVVLWLVIGAP